MREPELVTIIGGGVSGLTAAHELIERGYRVQVVEARRSQFKEYECEVGGLAASQNGRILETRMLYPHWYPTPRYEVWNRWDTQPGGQPDPDGVMRRSLAKTTTTTSTTTSTTVAGVQGVSDEEVHANRRLILERLRRLEQQEIAPVVSFPLRLGYGPDAMLINCARRDAHGASNGTKLQKIARNFINAYFLYRTDLRSRLAQLGKTLNEFGQEASLRETLLLQVRGHAGLAPSRSAELLAYRRAFFARLSIPYYVNLELQRAPFYYTGFSQFAQLLDSADLEALQRFYRVACDGARRGQYLGSTPDKQAGAIIDRSPRIPTRMQLAEMADSGGQPDCFEHYEVRHHLIAMAHVTGESPPFSINSPCEMVANEFHRVDFSVVQHLSPGEHGFRLFPSWYRHLFDTMKRTALIDERGNATRACLFDQLVTPPETEFASTGNRELMVVPKGGVETLAGARKIIRDLREKLKLTPKDLLRIPLQTFKFLTSSSARRERYEVMSWFSFMAGRNELAYNAADPVFDSGYSRGAERFLRDIPQALVAMSPDESDARTFGIPNSQLLHDFRRGDEAQDQILNGPTSEAWLRPWKRYLQQQGVHFFIGCLDALKENADGTGFLPVFSNGLNLWEDKPKDDKDLEDIESRPIEETGQARFDAGADYYVLALPYERVANVLAKAKRELGRNVQLREDFAAVIDLDVHAGRIDKRGHLKWDIRISRSGQIGDPARFPLRDFVGIQYFFPHQVRVGRSHVYYFDSPWGLTSIAHGQHWMQRPSQSNGFFGHLTVDIGKTYAANEDREYFWGLKKDQVAASVWDQILERLPVYLKTSTVFPTYYHIDDGIQEEPFLRRQRRLLHQAGWLQGRKREDVEGTTKDEWTEYVPPCPPCCYSTESLRLLLLNLVSACALPPEFPTCKTGTCPCRHACTEALLCEKCKTIKALAEWAQRERIRPSDRTSLFVALPGQWEHRPSCRTDGRVRYRISHEKWILAGNFMPTHTRLSTMEAACESGRHAVRAILADKVRRHERADAYPPIFPPEENEFPELEGLKEIDAELMKQRLPHMLDILGVPEWIDTLPDDEMPSRSTQLRRLAEVVAANRSIPSPILEDAADLFSKQIEGWFESGRGLMDLGRLSKKVRGD